MSVVITGTQALAEAAKLLADRAIGAATAADSLIAYTQPARVEPILLIDASCMGFDILPDTVQSLQSIFTGYYLQAFGLLNITSVDIVKHLDRLNPSRDVSGDFYAKRSWSMESFKENETTYAIGMESYKDLSHRLPVPADPRNREVSISMEAQSPSSSGRNNNQTTIEMEFRGGKANQSKKPGDVSASASVDNPAKYVNELANLSVGRLINIEVQDNGKTVKIPISIRLMANSIPTKDLLHIVTAGGENATWADRYYMWREGHIEFWRDLVFAQDLVDAHREHLKNDNSQFYELILKRRRGNSIAGAISGNMSINTASNLMIISHSTALELEAHYGKKLKDFATRKKLFDESYLMLLAVIESERDLVTFYHRGIPEPSMATLRDMKTANKSGNTDIASILAAFKSGNSPQFP